MKTQIFASYKTVGRSGRQSNQVTTRIVDALEELIRATKEKCSILIDILCKLIVNMKHIYIIYIYQSNVRAIPCSNPILAILCQQQHALYRLNQQILPYCSVNTALQTGLPTCQKSIALKLTHQTASLIVCRICQICSINSKSKDSL